MKYKKEEYIWILLRLSMGWIFLWAFLDKLFGLGFSTKADGAWIAGGSPTLGYLKFGTHGPLAPVFQAVAGNAFVDWLFMIGLLLLGLALILGMGIRIVGYSGALLMFLMWLSFLPPEHNLILDEHIIYALILISLRFTKAGHLFGFGEWWSNTKLVKKYPFLD